MDQPTPADPKRPKILSVSEPEQPKLSKPRVLTQIQATPQPEIPTNKQPQPPNPAGAARHTVSADPTSEADWTEQTLSQAEKDAEEQKMANDVTQAFASTVASPDNTQNEKSQAGQQAPKTEPKSVPGLLYAIKGLADVISRKITGK